MRNSDLANYRYDIGNGIHDHYCIVCGKLYHVNVWRFECPDNANGDHPFEFCSTECKADEHRAIAIDAAYEDYKDRLLTGD